MNITIPSASLLSCAVLAVAGNIDVLSDAAPLSKPRPQPIPQYQILDLGVVSGRAHSYVFNTSCLNNRGQVVGWSNDGAPYDFQNDSAFVWSPDVGLETLPGLPGAAMSLAVSINNRGVAVGFSGDPFPFSQPTRWTRRGPRALAMPEGYQGGMALGINNRGDVVGIVITEEFIFRAILWKDGEPILLPGVGDSEAVESICFGLNNRGLIVGMSDLKPAVWQEGEVLALGTFGGDRGQANGVNERNQVVGLAEDETGVPRAFLWDGGELVNLNTDESYTVALSINNKGQIVGSAGAGHPGGDAALWDRGQRVLLADTIPADTGWVLLEADCINGRGQITGMGLLNGQPRAFLLTPQP
jgi:probable HAF family extracellular repeat protein